MLNLDELEAKCITAIRKFSSVQLLGAVSRILKTENLRFAMTKDLFPLDNPGLQPFMAAGISNLAIRYSNAERNEGREVTMSDCAELCNLCHTFLTADPIATDRAELELFNASNPVLAMLRIIASQFRYFPYCSNIIGRTVLLFDRLTTPSGTTDSATFDFHESFRKITGLQVSDFIIAGLIVYSYASDSSVHQFTRKSLDDFRTKLLKIPDDDVLEKLFESICADPVKFREEYELNKQSDKRFRMYDYDPILTYPVIRPWKYKAPVRPQSDMVIVPIPQVLALRISTGIYYQMLKAFGTQFTKYFGPIFEEFVGRILQKSIRPNLLFSEKDLRRTYPPKKGKVPDWAILDGSRLVIVECKATRFQLKALVTGKEEWFQESLRQTVKGLEQLYEFQQQVVRRAEGLEQFHHCSEVIPLLLTFEPLYLVNSPFGRQFVDSCLNQKGISSFNYRIMAVHELEDLQPHLSSGISMGDAVVLRDGFKTETEFFEELAKQTGRSAKNSFLREIELEVLVGYGFSEP